VAHDVFISYSTKDKAIADAVCGTLEARGIRCWIAPRDIQPSCNWAAAVMDGIAESQVTVLIWSANASESTDVMREVHHAFRKGVAVIPFRVEAVAFKKELEFFLETVHWLDALTPPLEAHLERLAATLKALLKKDVTEAQRDKSETSPPARKVEVATGSNGGSSAKQGVAVRGPLQAKEHEAVDKVSATPRWSKQLRAIALLIAILISGLIVLAVKRKQEITPSPPPVPVETLDQADASAANGLQVHANDARRQIAQANNDVPRYRLDLGNKKVSGQSTKDRKKDIYDLQIQWKDCTKSQDKTFSACLIKDTKVILILNKIFKPIGAMQLDFEVKSIEFLDNVRGKPYVRVTGVNNEHDMWP
jgi:hypothetical protein